MEPYESDSVVRSKIGVELAKLTLRLPLHPPRARPMGTLTSFNYNTTFHQIDKLSSKYALLICVRPAHRSYVQFGFVLLDKTFQPVNFVPKNLTCCHPQLRSI